MIASSSSSTRHLTLGREQDLYFLSPDVGRGLVVWGPHGATIRHEIEQLWRSSHHAHGYEIVMTPHIAKSALWEESRHVDYHRESMFPPMRVDGSDYLVKGANCPLHMQVFGSRQRSHRALPVRLAEISTLYRNAPAGSLKGLRYVRSISQDDSHIFCRPEDVVDEIVRFLEFAQRMLRVFGFEDFRPYLGTRDNRSVDGDETWARGHAQLVDALRIAGLGYREVPGGATYYAPRVGIDVVDQHGTAWALPDIQIDHHLPELCGSTYTDSSGHAVHPIVIHRTLLGSIERFTAALLEHHGLAGLPGWLRPVHVLVLPVRSNHEEPSRALVGRLRLAGVRAELDDRRLPVAARIAHGAELGAPIVTAIGDRELEGSLRWRTYGVPAEGSEADLIAAAAVLAERPHPGLL